MLKVLCFLRAVAAVCLLLIAIATIGTFWVIQNSRERADCYKRVVDIADCEQPGRVERFIRGALAPNAIELTGRGSEAPEGPR